MQEQWRGFLRGLATVPDPRWVSDPEALHRAESKALQLAEAVEVGFEAPETLWTNDRQLAAGTLGAQGVVKSVATAYWEAERPRFVFARRMSKDDLPEEHDLAQQPMGFQREVAPKIDIRVTVVGEQVFAAQTAKTTTSLDWRLEDSPSWHPHELPAAISDRARTLVDRLGLRFSGIDLALTPAGYVFIELNPNGEWGWLQKAGLPIASAMADELAGAALGHS